MMRTEHQPTITGAAAADLRTLLMKDHARLEKLFQALVAAFRSGDRDEAAALWNEFESGLERHMALEDRLILPHFAKVHPAEAAALVREHALIRNSVSELGIGVDLHCTNADTVERFVRALNDHAKREDNLMYPWARANLDAAVRTSIRAG
jgi:hemerythrin-like domain-containing protein